VTLHPAHHYQYRMRKNSIAKLREVIRGNQTKIYCQGAVCQRCGIPTLRTLKLGLTKVGNQANQWSILIKSCISCQFRANVQRYGHRTRYTADNDASKVWRVRSKMPGCCLMVAAASTIREMRSSSESTSHRHIQRSLDWTERANCLASKVTGHNTNRFLVLGNCPTWRTNSFQCIYLFIVL